LLLLAETMDKPVEGFNLLPSPQRWVGAALLLAAGAWLLRSRQRYQKSERGTKPR
jgi:hypothetical protein